MDEVGKKGGKRARERKWVMGTGIVGGLKSPRSGDSSGTMPDLWT